jgi:hypothetical protein
MNVTRVIWSEFPGIKVKPTEDMLDAIDLDKLARIVMRADTSSVTVKECQVLSDSVVYVLQPKDKAGASSITDTDVAGIMMAIEDILTEEGFKIIDPLIRLTQLDPEPTPELTIVGPFTDESEVVDEVDDDVEAEPIVAEEEPIVETVEKHPGRKRAKKEAGDVV